MESIINTCAFLCGYFSIDEKTAANSGKILASLAGGSSTATDSSNGAVLTRTGSTTNGWKKVEYSKEHKDLLMDFYYPEFVVFCTETRSTYSFGVNRDITVPVTRENIPCKFHVSDIQMGFYPFGIVIFHIDLSFKDCPAELIRGALAKMRNCCFYENAGLDEFLEVVIDPIKRAFFQLSGKAPADKVSCPFLVESGNKFKIFQIVEGESVPRDDEEMNKFLYSCGTLSEYDENGLYSTSRDYYEKSIAESRLSVFNNWKALLLLDSVTFAAVEISDMSRNIWTNDYFGMIYLYELYTKIYLYRLNILFRIGRRKAADLYDEMKLFERRYTFSSISYNFLPNDVDKAIEANLRTKQVRNEVYHVIDQETTAQAAESDAKSNMFLTFLTLMASLSAVWDISSMIDALVNYESTFNLAATGYRLVVTLLIVVILLVALFSRRKKK